MAFERSEHSPRPVGESHNLPDKDKLIKDFLKTLKVAFKMATIYKMEHPAFKKTVQDLMAGLEAFFQLLGPLSIGFTPHSLFLDNRFWENEKSYLDLAKLFHLRKIKSLHIRPGIPPEELMRFASKITLPLKEFIKEGGAQNILKTENIIYITLEVLDYSQLLLGEGEEIKDIWPYLLMEAVQEDDRLKLDQLAGSFERVVGKFNTEDLIQNEELHKNFAQFFRYLKETAEGKYRSCAKSLLKSILACRKISSESKFENLKLLISDLREDDLASTLWEEVIGNDKFDSLSFSIFTRIIDKERHKKISTSLRQLFHSDDPQNRRPELEQKIKTLLSGTSGQLLSDIYRQTLSCLLSEISFEKKCDLDHQLLQRNYRFILLNLLAREKQRELAVRQMERILEEWEKVAQEKDLEYLESLLRVFQSRPQELGAEPAFQKVRESLSRLVEDFILEGDGRPGLDPFIEKLKESIHDQNIYLNRIFVDKKVSPTLLRAYFGFFSSFLADFTARLKRKASDSQFLEKIADSLKSIDQPVSLTVLKSLYLVGDARVKLRALKAMSTLSEFDEGFLFSVLESKDRLLQAEALVLLMRYERTKHVAFTKLLNLQSPYGIRNKRLIGHIRIVEEKSLVDAGPFLKSLGQRKDFWNRKVRREAARVLEKWGEG